MICEYARKNTRRERYVAIRDMVGRRWKWLTSRPYIRLNIVVLRSGIPPRRDQNFGTRDPGPMSSVKGNPVTIRVFYSQKGNSSEVTPL